MQNNEFIIKDVPATKEEVRSIVLSKLQLYKAKNFLDIGSGSGTISVEAGVVFKNLNVFAIEKKEKALDLTRQNIEKFNLNNVVLLKGDAPYINLDNKKFDSVFIGGTGGNLSEIITWSRKIMNKNAKLVMSFIIVETFFYAKKILKEQGFKNIDIVNVNVSRLEKLGSGEYFKPNNPIYIISCTK